jgi:hypothetical protein
MAEPLIEPDAAGGEPGALFAAPARAGHRKQFGIHSERARGGGAR